MIRIHQSEPRNSSNLRSSTTNRYFNTKFSMQCFIMQQMGRTCLRCTDNILSTIKETTQHTVETKKKLQFPFQYYYYIYLINFFTRKSFYKHNSHHLSSNKNFIVEMILS